MLFDVALSARDTVLVNGVAGLRPCTAPGTPTLRAA